MTTLNALRDAAHALRTKAFDESKIHRDHGQFSSTGGSGGGGAAEKPAETKPPGATGGPPAAPAKLSKDDALSHLGKQKAEGWKSPVYGNLSGSRKPVMETEAVQNKANSGGWVKPGPFAAVEMSASASSQKQGKEEYTGGAFLYVHDGFKYRLRKNPKVKSGSFSSPAEAMKQAEILHKVGVDSGAVKPPEPGSGLAAAYERRKGEIEAIQDQNPGKEILPSGAVVPDGHTMCSKCGGAGSLGQFAHVEGGVCFQCDGAGHVPGRQKGHGLNTLRDAGRRLKGTFDESKVKRDHGKFSSGAGAGGDASPAKEPSRKEQRLAAKQEAKQASGGQAALWDARGAEIRDQHRDNMLAVLVQVRKGDYDANRNDAIEDMKIRGEQAKQAEKNNWARSYQHIRDTHAAHYGEQAMRSPEWQAVKDAHVDGRDETVWHLHQMTDEATAVVATHVWHSDPVKFTDKDVQGIRDQGYEHSKAHLQALDKIHAAVTAFRAAHKPLAGKSMAAAGFRLKSATARLKGTFDESKVKRDHGKFAASAAYAASDSPEYKRGSVAMKQAGDGSWLAKQGGEVYAPVAGHVASHFHGVVPGQDGHTHAHAQAHFAQLGKQAQETLAKIPAGRHKDALLLDTAHVSHLHADIGQKLERLGPMPHVGDSGYELWLPKQGVSPKDAAQHATAVVKGAGERFEDRPLRLLSPEGRRGVELHVPGWAPPKVKGTPTPRAKSKDASGHEHDAAGRFGTGGAGGSAEPAAKTPKAGKTAPHPLAGAAAELAAKHPRPPDPPQVPRGAWANDEPHNVAARKQYEAAQATHADAHYRWRAADAIHDVLTEPHKLTKLPAEGAAASQRIGRFNRVLEEDIAAATDQHDTLHKPRGAQLDNVVASHPHGEALLKAARAEATQRLHAATSNAEAHLTGLPADKQALGRDATAKGLRAASARLKSSAARLKARTKPLPVCPQPPAVCDTLPSD